MLGPHQFISVPVLPLATARTLVYEAVKRDERLDRISPSARTLRSTSDTIRNPGSASKVLRKEQVRS